MKELQADVRGGWLVDVHINVLEVASVEVDLIDVEVLEILEDVGQYEVDTLVHTGLSDRDAQTWTLRSLGRKCGTCN